jgi:hypothetical protein
VTKKTEIGKDSASKVICGMFMKNERVAALRYALIDLIRGISGVCGGN